MTEPTPNNNEFNAAELELRKIGSNMWFGGLSNEWQHFMVSYTVELFDNYEISMSKAADTMIKIYQQLVKSNPTILEKNPWELELNINI